MNDVYMMKPTNPKLHPIIFFSYSYFFFCLFVIVLIDYNCTDTHLGICHATSHRFSGGCAVGSGRKSAGCGRVARRITGVDDGGCCGGCRGRSRSRSRSDDGFAVVTATAIATATATRRWMVMMVDAFLTVRRVHHVVSINDSSGQHTHTHTHTNTTRV